jgi:hypothetical protein
VANVAVVALVTSVAVAVAVAVVAAVDSPRKSGMGVFASARLGKADGRLFLAGTGRLDDWRAPSENDLLLLFAVLDSRAIDY